MNIFAGADVPAWLAERELLIQKNRPNWGGLIGTLAAGATRALTEKQPVMDENGDVATDDNGQPITRRPSFWEGVGEARMSQQDPMWPMKMKALEAQIAGNEALSTARWLSYDMRTQQAQHTQDSLAALQGYDGSTPVPTGITDPKVLGIANKQRADYMNAQLKTQKLENDFAAIQQKLDNQAQELGIKTERLAFDRQKLASREDEFDKKLQAQTALENQRQEHRMEVEKLRALSRVDAAGRPLTRQQYINRHFNSVYAQMSKDNPDPSKPITIGAVQNALSEAFDNIPSDGTSPTGKALPKVISITPAQ